MPSKLSALRRERRSHADRVEEDTEEVRLLAGLPVARLVIDPEAQELDVGQNRVCVAHYLLSGGGANEPTVRVWQYLRPRAWRGDSCALGGTSEMAPFRSNSRTSMASTDLKTGSCTEVTLTPENIGGRRLNCSR